MGVCIKDGIHLSVEAGYIGGAGRNDPSATPFPGAQDAYAGCSYRPPFSLGFEQPNTLLQRANVEHFGVHLDDLGECSGFIDRNLTGAERRPKGR